MSKPNGPGDPKVAWGVVGAVTAVGLVGTAAPFLLAWWNNDDKFGDWHALTSSTATNVGTALLLAAGLVLIEPFFTRRANKNTQRLVQRQTAPLEQANRELATQLSDLKTAVENRFAADVEDRDTTVDGIRGDVTFATITKALEKANDINALWYDTITVPTSRNLHGPKIMFDWRWLQEGFSGAPQRDVLNLSVFVHQGPGETRTRLTEDIEWGPDEHAVDVIARLQNLLTKEGHGKAAHSIDATYLFGSLLTGIKYAIKGRHGVEPSFWVVGQVREVITDKLIITSDGLAVAGYGIGLTPSRWFPDQPSPWGGLQKRVHGYEADPKAPPFPPDRPDGVSDTEWEYALAQAQTWHPRRVNIETLLAPFTGTRSGEPINTANSPYA